VVAVLAAATTVSLLRPSAVIDDMPCTNPPPTPPGVLRFISVLDALVLLIVFVCGDV
jgi:hypothetical protein